MNMIEVKTAELIGPALDWAVAQAAGVTVRVLSADNPGEKWQVQKQWRHEGPYWPSQDWSQIGPLIAKMQVSLHAPRTSQGGSGREGWNANCQTVDEPDFTVPEHWVWQSGETPIIAACRAIVAAKLGYVVSVPAELVNGG